MFCCRDAKWRNGRDAINRVSTTPQIRVSTTPQIRVSTTPQIRVSTTPQIRVSTASYCFFPML